MNRRSFLTTTAASALLSQAAIGHTQTQADKPNVLFIAVAAFVLSAIATIFPARRAAKVEPAEALRYD